MARGRKSRKSKQSRRRSKAISRRRKSIRRRVQKGGEAHIPPEYFPPKSIVNVRDSSDYESPFFVTDLATAERDFIAAAERPADPYDQPGAESELVAEVSASKSKEMTRNTSKEQNAESTRREELQEIETLNRGSAPSGGRRK